MTSLETKQKTYQKKLAACILKDTKGTVQIESALKCIGKR